MNLFSCCFCRPHRSRGKYEMIEILGQGSNAFVLKCRKTDTQEIVAVKLLKQIDDEREVQMMRKLMRQNLHEHNIVRFMGSLSSVNELGLVMEVLDINLDRYIKSIGRNPMPLSDIRNIIQQMAVALDALKSINIIHADIKSNNIMMVDHRTRPLRVKLIDFGLAMDTSETEQGMQCQHRLFRAPEVMLGLPFTEAIDMWSLGCVMARMLTREPLICGRNLSSIMECIVHHCGQPPDHLLNKGLFKEMFFSRTETNAWTIKECLSHVHQCHNYEAKVQEDRLDNKDEAEALETRQCLDLLWAMLRVDPAERITPAEVLVHPFIDKDSVSAAAAAPCSTTQDKEITNIQPACRSPSPTIPPSHVIDVQPATTESTL